MCIKKYTYIAFTLLIVLLVSSSFHMGSTAYTLNSRKQCNFYIKWRWGGMISTLHKKGIQQAFTDWNGAQSKRKFSNGGSSARGVLDSYSTPDESYGYALINYSEENNCVTSWVVKLNKYYDTNHITLARSTANHELGHVLGLDHTKNSDTVMFVGRNRFQIYTPRKDDIAGVNALY